MLKKSQSLLILGPRGTGKSFYINHILETFQSKILIDLLDTEFFDRFLKHPEHLPMLIDYELREKKREVLLVFIDEIQRVPSLLNEVHRMIEKHHEKIQFILTGFSARKLKKSHANLLAGRAIYLPFHPFSFNEIDVATNLNKIMQFGTLPKAFLENDNDLVIDYLKTYMHSYLKEEIQQESLLRNIEAFALFLEFAAFENGMPVNYAKIARQISISPKTVQGHFEILEDTLLAMKIPAWTFSIRKRLLKMPKYYFFDNGVLNSLRGELRTELNESSYRFGRLFENMVVNEIARYNIMRDMDFKLYHYRTIHGSEIDLIMQRNIKSSPLAIEIKSSKNPDHSDVKQLTRFKEDVPNAQLFVLCRTREPYIDKGIEFHPYISGINEIFKRVN